MATTSGKKPAKSHSKHTRPRSPLAAATVKKSVRTVKSPPKGGLLSKAAVRSAVASVVLAHKK
jgi:hypothetical protein